MISVIFQSVILAEFALCIVLAFVGKKQEAKRTKEIHLLWVVIECHRAEMERQNEALEALTREHSRGTKP